METAQLTVALHYIGSWLCDKLTFNYAVFILHLNPPMSAQPLGWVLKHHSAHVIGAYAEEEGLMTCSAAHHQTFWLHFWGPPLFSISLIQSVCGASRSHLTFSHN